MICKIFLRWKWSPNNFLPSFPCARESNFRRIQYAKPIFLSEAPDHYQCSDFDDDRTDFDFQRYPIFGCGILPFSGASNDLAGLGCGSRGVCGAGRFG